jgi:hypothetical protein
MRRSLVVTGLVYDDHRTRGAFHHAVRGAALQPRLEPAETSRTDHDRRGLVVTGDVQDRACHAADIGHGEGFGLQAEGSRQLGALVRDDLGSTAGGMVTPGVPATEL